MAWKKEVQNLLIGTNLSNQELQNIIRALSQFSSQERVFFIDYIRQNKKEILFKLTNTLARRKRAIKSNNIRLLKIYLEADTKKIKQANNAIKELEDKVKIAGLRKKITKK